MELLPVLSLAVLIGMLVGLAVYVVVFQKQRQSVEEEPDDEGEAVPVRQAGRRGVDRMRRQLRQRHAAQQAAAARRGSDSEASDEEEDDEAVPLNRREARRMERAEARAEAEAAREARAAKISAYEERRRKKEEEREARERTQEEEMRRAADEKQRAEDEEAAKWMNMISVEQTGTVEEQAAGEDQGLLGRFIDYVQSRKMVPVEEAAAEFGLRSSEVVDRLQGLEAMGRITGVMDERGKFIYISREEMEAVAAFIRRQGRVSIAALAAASNDLIDLEARSVAEAQAGRGGGGGGAALGVGPALDFEAVLGSGGGEGVAVA